LSPSTYGWRDDNCASRAPFWVQEHSRHLCFFREHFIKCVRGPPGASPEVYSGPHRDTTRIIEDEGGDNPPVFSTASQNVMAAALLLRAMPEPSTPEGRRVRQGLRSLLEQAVVQNAESFAS